MLGHSWGGILAVHYAVKYPDNLKGLILSNSPTTSFGAFHYQKEVFKKIRKELKLELGRKPSDKELNERFEKTYRYGLDTIPEAFSRLEEHYSRDPKRWETTFFKQKKWTLENEAKKITASTLIIGGEKDFIDPNDFKLMSNAIVNSKLVILSNGSHFSMWSDSENYFNAIDEFIMSSVKH